jgi:DNA-binding GntR family transcriptional regulator
MNEVDHFKVFIFYSDGVTTDMNHLHVKRIHLVDFHYIIIEDSSIPSSKKLKTMTIQNLQHTIPPPRATEQNCNQSALIV